MKIKACGKGVKIDGDTVGVLLYADGIVLLVDNEKELQDMLDILNNWCVSNNMSVLRNNILVFYVYVLLFEFYHCTERFMYIIFAEPLLLFCSQEV